jgi:hypothetical protein
VHSWLRIASHIPNLGVKGWSVQLHAPSDLLSGEVPPVPIGYEGVRAAEPVWTLCRREKPLAPGSPFRSRAMPAQRHLNCVGQCVFDEHAVFVKDCFLYSVR